MINIKKEKIIEWLWLIAIIGFFLISLKMVRSGELQTFVASFGILAPIVIIALKMSTLIIAPLGGTPLYLLSGALFGNLVGFLICFIADVLGSMCCFFISRKYGARVVRIFVGENFYHQIQKLLNLLSNTKSFLKARFALFSLPEVFAYAAGLSRVGFLKFIFIHSIFIAPLSLVGVFFGSQLASLTARYSIFIFVITGLIVASGLSMFWKDYEKMEGM